MQETRNLGPVFDFLHCSRYIHLNPVKAHLCAKPDDYAWSSYRRYLGSDPGLDWIDVSKTLDCFASSTDYAAFVLQGLQQDLADPFDEAIGVSFSAAMPLLRRSARSCARLT